MPSARAVHDLLAVAWVWVVLYLVVLHDGQAVDGDTMQWMTGYVRVCGNCIS